MKGILPAKPYPIFKRIILEFRSTLYEASTLRLLLTDGRTAMLRTAAKTIAKRNFSRVKERRPPEGPFLLL